MLDRPGRAMSRPFRQVDVFTEQAYRGNPVAVVGAGADLDTETMRAFARWTNLSETTFLLPPTDPAADYRVRIFTPVTELPFAGHPTLGSAHAWLELGGAPAKAGTVVQECGVGLVQIRRTPTGLAFAAPALIRSGPVADVDLDRIVTELGITRADVLDAHWVDNGPGWVAVLLADVDALLALRPGTLSLEVGAVAFHPAGASELYEVRAFFPKDGLAVEDPVTGSLNASLAQWLIGTGRAQAPYTASQGTTLARAGRVHIERDDDGTIWVGGGTVTCVSGHVRL